ncbi:hypothetical protein CPC08DRAFT_728206 [Agrocybe pediades]|nr:hypothetical protein CPC08DRAFT_728206 [Agrocybe pediades]
MVNPGAFQGARKEFLLGEKPAYIAGVQGGYSKDALALIQRRYFKRFPIKLPHDKDPSAEHLAAVDDDEPDPELDPLNEDLMLPEDYTKELERRDERRKQIEFRKAQIKRWLSYQYMKDHDLDPKESGAQNPYHTLLFKLTGKSTNRPRRKPAINVWRRGVKDLIETATKDEVLRTNAVRGQVAGLRQRVANRMLERLPATERGAFEEEACEEYEAELAQWQKDMEGQLSESPESRQRCIEGLVRFMQPILDLVAEATGWKCSFMAGGPEPAHGGRLNVISVHAGTTSGDIKMNFGRAERVRYKDEILPIFGHFLKMCYTPDECRARALKAEEGFTPVDAQELETMGAGLYTFNDTFREHRSPSSHTSSPNSTIVHPASTAPLPAKANIPSQHLNTSANNREGNQPPVPAASPLTSGADGRVDSVFAGGRQHGGLIETTVQHDPGSIPSATRFPSVPLSPLCSPHASPLPSRPPSPVPSRPPSPIPSHPPSPVPSRPPSPLLSHLASAVPHPASPLPAIVSRAQMTVPLRASRSSSNIPATLQSKQHEAQSGSSSIAGGDADRETPIAGAASTVVGTGGRPASMAVRSKRSAEDTIQHPSKRRRGIIAAGTAESSVGDVSIPRVPRTARKKQVNSSANLPPAPPTPASETTFRLPSGAPEWLQKSAGMFSEQTLGDRWIHLLNVWVKFEAGESYVAQGALKAGQRPPCVGDWIGRRRSTVWRPKLGGVADFAVAYMNWWTVLQPSWRVTKQGKIKFASTNGDWDVLRKPGINGLQSIIVALFFWGLEVQKQGCGTKDWLVAVEDFIVACSHLQADAS